GPMLEGAYPERVFADTAPVTDWSFVRDGDLEVARAPLDLLGVNYYSTGRVRRRPEGAVQEPGVHGHGASEHTTWPGADDVLWLRQPGPYTAMGWNIEPAGMTDLLLEMHTRYPDLPLMVTENGAAFEDVVVEEDGVRRIHDDRRIDYIARHLAAIADA